MADFSSSYLLKLFVKVPTGVTFDGASTTASSKVYFDENTYTIWAKGKQYGISPEFKTKVDDLVSYVGASTDTAAADGSLYARIAAAVAATNELRATTYGYTDTLYADKNTANSIQAIAYDVANMVVYDTLEIGEDTAYIDRIKEVIDWFQNVSETESGAALLSEVASLRTDLGNPTDTASVNGSAFAQIAYLKTQVSEKNVAAEGETGADALVYSYADANKVFTYSSTKLTTAVGLAETSVQAVIGESDSDALVSVAIDGTDSKQRNVTSTQKLKDAVAKAEASAQSISIATADEALLSVTDANGAYTIGYTTALGTAVTNANSAIQGLTVATYNLSKTNNTLSAENLKGIVLGGISGTATYTDAASDITVNITYADGVITGVTLSGAALDTRVDDIESFITEYDPWQELGA